MEETRSVKISAVLTPTDAARLDTYRERHHWSRSTAIAVLLTAGLIADEKEEAQSQ